ncbi:MAG: catalase [Chloroflexota bacterium]
MKTPNEKTVLTTAAGYPLSDDQNTITAGPRGPVLLQDFHLLEKLAHFNRERIPERVVHAKGAGAYGTFRVTNDITAHTRAKIFSAVGKETPMLLRFSTVGGEKGSADTARDPRGFAMKFYTEEGNWDLTGNNTPVFFIRDPLKFPDFIHTQKRDPETNLKSFTMMWDFWSLSPESLHQVTILFSDRGTPDGFRHMDGFGSHTFSLINAKNERVWVKFHAKTMQGIRNLAADTAEQLAGSNPDYATQDLFDAIEQKDFPRWRFSVQIMTDEQAASFHYNPFDLTKIWPHSEFPLIEVGTIELNRNPQNYFAEIEQSAFTPANVIPGVSFSPDKMLQARIMSYGDAHRYRLGANYETLPVNHAHAPVNNNQRDGFMAFNGNSGSAPNYNPNSFNGPEQAPEYSEPPIPVDGEGARYNHRDGNDDYTQPGDLFRLMTPDEQARLLDNIAGSMMHIPTEIQMRQIAHFYKADPAYGQGVEDRLKVAVKP